MNSKLQVFVSSTYIDMKTERQAAIEEILGAGHIPAGMELFAAGDQSQWEVIKQWIEESDVYMLILGGRYGSIEQKSQKSYTHLEYEYALSIKKPHFSIVIDEKALEEKCKRLGPTVIERSSPKLLDEFRSVVSKKMVAYYSDEKDIKLGISRSLREINKRDNLQGWVRAEHQIDLPKTTRRLVELSEENDQLRSKLSTLTSGERFFGQSFEEISYMLRQGKIKTYSNYDSMIPYLTRYQVQLNKDAEDFDFMDFLIAFGSELVIGGVFTTETSIKGVLEQLALLGLVSLPDHSRDSPYKFTIDGHKFYARALANLMKVT